MLTFLTEPVRLIAGVLESIVVFVGSLFVAGVPVEPPGEYLTQLNLTGIFSNCAQNAIPQTKVHDIVLSFFEEDHGAKTPKCLVIGYDGARADALVNTKDDPTAGTQVLKADGGAIYNMYTGGNWYQFNLQDTSTACGWTTMLTGHWAREWGGTGHGVTANGVTKAADAPKLVFTELLDKGLAKKTAFFASWGGHFAGSNASYLNDMAYCVGKGFDATWFTADDDQETFDKTLAAVRAANGGDMIMCILEYCDHAGHGNGFSNRVPAYVQAIKDSERDAAALIAAVKGRGTYGQEDWLILISADHGGVYTGHGQQFAGQRQIFLAANKKVW